MIIKINKLFADAPAASTQIQLQEKVNQLNASGKVWILLGPYTSRSEMKQVTGFSDVGDDIVSVGALSNAHYHGEEVWFLDRGELRLVGSKVHDFGSLVDGAQETTTLTVTGAALGDPVISSFSLTLQGMMLTAYVSSTNTVTFVLQNESGGTINLDSGTLKAVVLKF